MFIRLKKFLSLEPEDQRILAYALCLVVFARLILWLVPFAMVQRRLSAHITRRNIPPRHDREYFMKSIERSAKLVPGATCLTQSLAARLLLARAGFDATLRFGVRRNATGDFEAHAWVESGGKVVGPELPATDFSPLPPVGPASAAARTKIQSKS